MFLFFFLHIIAQVYRTQVGKNALTIKWRFNVFEKSLSDLFTHKRI